MRRADYNYSALWMAVGVHAVVWPADRGLRVHYYAMDGAFRDPHRTAAAGPRDTLLQYHAPTCMIAYWYGCMAWRHLIARRASERIYACRLLYCSM